MRAAENRSDSRAFDHLMSHVVGRHLLTEPLSVGHLSRRSDECRRGIGARAFDRSLDDRARNRLSRRRSETTADHILRVHRSDRASHATDEVADGPAVPARSVTDLRSLKLLLLVLVCKSLEAPLRPETV
jgi:hypothetical protein